MGMGLGTGMGIGMGGADTVTAWVDWRVHPRHQGLPERGRVFVLLQGRAGLPAQCRYVPRRPAHCLLDRGGRLRPARQAPARRSAGVPVCCLPSRIARIDAPASQQTSPASCPLRAHTSPARLQPSKSTGPSRTYSPVATRSSTPSQHWPSSRALRDLQSHRGAAPRRTPGPNYRAKLGHSVAQGITRNYCALYDPWGALGRAAQ